MQLNKRVVLRTLLGFALLFVLFNWPARPLGVSIATRASVLANAVLRDDALGSDLGLRFAPAATGTPEPSLDQAWTLAMRADRPSSGARTYVPFNLRKIFWIPSSVFVALTLAAPIRPRRRRLAILGIGMLVLQLPNALAAVLLARALLFEAYVLDLSAGAQSALRFGHALLARPGIVYALPLLLWTLLVVESAPAAPEAA